LSKWALIAAPPAIGMLYTNTFTGDGTTTVFTLTDTPASKNNTQLFIDGIYQPKDGYLLNGQLLTITPAPSAGSDIEVSIGVPSTSTTVADGAISSVKLADEAVTTSKIFDLSVTSGKIANSAISTEKIQDAAVTGEKLTAGSVGLNKLADGAVSFVKIADGAVGSEKIANNSVVQAKIADNAVASSKIANNAVTQAKLAANVVGNGPLFRAYQSSSQSFGANSPTKINLQTEDFDTNSNFSSSRFTATVEGYYSIFGAVEMSSFTDRIIAIIYKNGSAYSRGSQSGAGSGYVSQVLDIVYLNGSTDYIELYGLHFEGASRTTVPASASTHLAGCLIRSA
jgi:hypothetical protein